jgi:hypothetical protein
VSFTSLKVRPCELREANAFIEVIHRHHKPAVGHRFSLSLGRRSSCGRLRVRASRRTQDGPEAGT